VANQRVAQASQQKSKHQGGHLFQWLAHSRCAIQLFGFLRHEKLDAVPLGDAVGVVRRRHLYPD